MNSGVRRLVGTLPMLFVCAAIGHAQDGPMAAVSSADGRFEVFFETTRGIEHFWQTKGSNTWTRYAAPYQPAPEIPRDVSAFLPASVQYRPTIAAGRDGGGCLTAAWIVNGRVYFVHAETPGGSLFEPGKLIERTTGGVRSVAMATNPDGRLELFTLGFEGSVTSFRQNAVCSGGWGLPKAWTDRRFKSIAVTRLGDQIILVGVIANNDPNPNFARPGSVVLVRETQATFALLGESINYVTAHQSIDNRLELFAHGGDALVWQRYTRTPLGLDFIPQWDRAIRDDTGVAPPIHVVATNDGRLHVISTKQPEARILRVSQDEPNGGWEFAWSTLPTGATYPTAIEADSGPTSVAVTPDGSVVGLFEYRHVTERNLTFRHTEASSKNARTSTIWSMRELVGRIEP